MKPTHREQPQRRRSAAARTAMPDLCMPAMPPLGLMAAVDRWIEARRRRRALRQLLALDDHLLCDLGLTREHLSEATRAPGPSAARRGSAR